jgi:tetratricopeptide (TPR) repeat protein
VVIIMANQLLEQREYDLATFVLEEALQKFSQDHQLQQLLMMTYTLNQQSPDRVRDYIELLKGGDTFSPDTIAIGDAYIAFQTGDTEQSIQILTTHLEQNRLDFKTELQFVLGMAHKEAGNIDAARSLLEAARSDRSR